MARAFASGRGSTTHPPNDAPTVLQELAAFARKWPAALRGRSRYTSGHHGAEKAREGASLRAWRNGSPDALAVNEPI